MLLIAIIDQRVQSVDHNSPYVTTSPAIAAIRALPDVVEEVDGRCEILVDGGVRRGTDIVKALALGARAVLIGRPLVWGLAWNGAAGVVEVLRILAEEFDTAMALCGACSPAHITPDLAIPSDRP